MLFYKLEFDMFADSPMNLEHENLLNEVPNVHSQYEWDDEEGYLKINIGEIINN